MKTSTKFILVSYFLVIVVFTGFFLPVTIKSNFNNTVENRLLPLYAKVYEEGPWEEFKKYDWYEPSGELKPTEKIVLINIPKYIIYILLITVAFAALYIIFLPAKRE